MRLCLRLILSAGAAAAAHKLVFSSQRGASPLATPQNCDSLPGLWNGGFSSVCGESPIGDSYSFNWTQPRSPGAWTATDESGGGWTQGLAQNSPDNSTVVITLDGRTTLRGNITSTKAGGQCSCIQWDNGSWWMKSGPPPPPITDVHIGESSPCLSGCVDSRKWPHPTLIQTLYPRRSCNESFRRR